MPETLTYKYLRPEDIRKLQSFEFAPKVLAEGFLVGRHRSRTQGTSLEFRDYRPYVPGDNPALIDWRAYARTDRFYLRTFELETNLECHIFLDSSASMSFGSPISKLEYSNFFCAALSYVVIKNTDRVSLTLFDDAIRSFIPPGSTSQHMAALMHTLERNKPGNRTRLAQALRKSLPLLTRRSTIIVVSDFFDTPADIFEALNPFIHRGFRIHLFQILDPAEISLDTHGLRTFVDMETGQRVVANADALRSNYRHAVDEHIELLRDLSARRGVQFFSARTHTHYFSLFEQLTG